MPMKTIAAAASAAAVLTTAAPVLAATTMTFEITVTGVNGSAVLPATTVFQESFTLQDGVLSGAGPSTDLMGALSGGDALTAGLQGLVDLSGATDYSNWDLGTFSNPGVPFLGIPPSNNTQGDLYENLSAANGHYTQSIDGGSLANYLPPSQDAAGLADFFRQGQPLTWSEQVADAGFNPVAGFSGTAELLSFSGDGAGVPEPAAWALMVLGFGGAGALLRRRRSALAA